jgi:epoxyqueuosine reductase QueG
METDLKESIFRQAKLLGATLVGVAPVSRWDEFEDVPKEYRPKAVWSQTETVVVMAVPILLPIIESTPSINYQELYNVTNRLLDTIAYQLAVFLNEKGYASIYIPRDGYGNLEILRRKPRASFSHVYAGKYAGLGTVGMSHMLLTPEYGPRVRLVSVLTSATISGSPLPVKELCPKCGKCVQLCPVKAFTPDPDRIVAKMRVDPCTERHQQLRSENRWPCGICAKVCPIGSDRKLYKRTDLKIYENEARGHLEVVPAPPYSEWQHMRAHGTSEVLKK